MFVILPVICFFLTFFILCILLVDEEARVRVSILLAAIIWGSLLTISTEVLGVINQISFLPIVIFWGIIDSILICILITIIVRTRPVFNLEKIELSAVDIILLMMIVLIVLVEAVIGIVAPPNTWDSMTYHIARVVHWIQNQSVAFYPTHIVRQNYQMPWAEFAIMHLQVLSGSDCFANLVQWFSALSSIIGVSLIAKLFGANKRIQIITSVMAATIPMGILQASSTQNDYVVGFWLVCFAFFTIKSLRKLCWRNTIAAGASLGLAMLTKGTAYIYAFPFCVWLIIGILVRNRPGVYAVFKHVIIIGLIVLAMNIFFFTRNLNLYGHILDAGQKKGASQFNYSNDDISIPIIFSNIVRNMALHMGTPYEQINNSIERKINTLLGSEISNPLSTWGGTSLHIGFSYHEDNAGNLLHFIFAVLALIMLVFFRQSGENKDLARYCLILISAYLLFCVYLRWQPWHSRLHLPLFILVSPMVGMALYRFMPLKLITFIVFVFFCSAVPFLLWNSSRPFIGEKNIFNINRLDQYFINRPDIKKPYKEAIDVIVRNNIDDVGLVLGGDDWEYVLWVLLKERHYKVSRIEHVNISNSSKKLISGRFIPIAIISMKNSSNKITLSDAVYFKMWSRGRMGIYVNFKKLVRRHRS